MQSDLILAKIGEYVMGKNTVYSLVSIFILMGVFGLAFMVQRAEADGPIYIRADGSVDPVDASIVRDGNFYTLTCNITTGTDGVIVERNNMTLDGAGYSLIGEYTSECTALRIERVNNITIINTRIIYFVYAIKLNQSSFVDVFGNAITNNHYGLIISNSTSTTIVGNNMTDNLLCINLWGVNTKNTVIGENIISLNQFGVDLLESSDNIIYGNNITRNQVGIKLKHSSYNQIYANNITQNHGYGIYVWEHSENNRIYHNNFIDNNGQFRSIGYVNSWDNGYPSGGNYWSDYEEKYPDATEIGHSGIGNVPYYIDYNNEDRYPLMEPIPEFPSLLILPLFMIATLLAAIFYRRKNTM